MTDAAVVGPRASSIKDDAKAIDALRQALAGYSNGGAEELLTTQDLAEATRGIHCKVLVGYIRSELKAIWIRAAGVLNLLRSGPQVRGCLRFRIRLLARSGPVRKSGLSRSAFARNETALEWVSGDDFRCGLMSRENTIFLFRRLFFSETPSFLSEIRYCKGALP